MSESDITAAVIALVTAVITTLATVLIKERVGLSAAKELHQSNADLDYQYEQRKALRDKIGEYRGQLLEAATDFNYRLANLDANHREAWLKMGGVYDQPPGEAYYFRTTVYRFVILLGVANRFEREALVIDSRIASSDDTAFLLYVKAMRWAITDANLFKGVDDYRLQNPTDHLLTDRLREICGAIHVDGKDLRFGAFEAKLREESGFNDVLRFFDGLRPEENRWDRVAVLRLMLLGFINTFGYPMQEVTQAEFNLVAEGIAEPLAASNFRDPWLRKLGLDALDEGAKIRHALDTRLVEHRATES